MKKAPKISKNMGNIQKVGQYDPNFQRFLREYGHKNVGKILSSPSSMRKAYDAYLKSKMNDFRPDEIPF